MTDEKVEKAVKFMIWVAKDDRHGYSQIHRNGNPDYDCSSLVIASYRQAGFNLEGATYTGNMLKAFQKEDFKNIVKQVNLTTGQGLKRGDILLNTAYHTAVYIGDGKMVHAKFDEKGGIQGKIPGDQTGNEIAVTPYSNYRRGGWNAVLRYVSKSQKQPNTKKGESEMVEKRDFIVNGKKEKLDTIMKDNCQYVKLRELQRVGLLKAIWDSNTKTTTLK